MSMDSDCSLCSDFFVFNSKLSKNEDDEDKKILFYHPSPTPLSQQHISIGLCEAVIHFVEPFTEKPIQSLHTEKRAFYLYSPEPDVWWVMVMEKPHSTERVGSTGSSAPAAGAASQSIGTHSGPMEGIGREEWTDECMLKVLSTTYKMFRLLHGPILATLFGNHSAEEMAAMPKEERETIQEEGRLAAVKLLKAFLPPLVINLQWDRVDLFTTLAGMHFLPLNKNVYLAVQRFVNTLENKYSAICDTTVLFKDHLVWSGLDQDDIRVLYKLYTAHTCQATSDFQPMLDITERFRNPQIRFVTGPENPADSDSPMHLLPVYIGPNAQRHQLVLYHTGNIAIFFLLKDDKEKPLEHNWYGLLDNDVFRHLQDARLGQTIADSYARKEQFDDQYKYIYFNRMNLALKTSLTHKGSDVPPVVMKVLSAMHEQFVHPTDAISEVLVKTVNDIWIVGRCTEEREFYLIFDKSKDKDVTLVEINEQVKHLSMMYFQSIFIAE